MCGLAGVLFKNDEKPQEADLLAMANALAHRGPDGRGLFIEGPMGLAHQRLAVIDLSAAAAQPFASEDGRVHVAYNGEVYNFRLLREELEQDGLRFRTASDTEVIIRAYQAYGPEFVRKLDGMFAFAIWDAARNKLVLARDRAGKKPLYLYEDAHKVVFASEIEAILRFPGVDSSRDYGIIAPFLSLGYVPTPRTGFSRIRKLEPARFEIFTKQGRESVATYWELPSATEAAPSLHDAVRDVRTAFFSAVRKRLIADVPIGAFLSGGIDSTLVVAAMAREVGRPFKTFCVKFAGSSGFDESSFARAASKEFGTEHTELELAGASEEDAHHVLRMFGEPYGDSSALPTHLLSRAARREVTVVLNGDGGDELFAGYPRFARLARLESLSRRVPGLRSLAALLARVAPRGVIHRKASRLHELLRGDFVSRYADGVRYFSQSELADFLTPDGLSEGCDLGLEPIDDSNGDRDLVNRMLRLNFRSYLLDDLNPKVDRATMAASLEARTPFLDTSLVECVSRLSGRFKLRGAETKWLLRRAFGDLLSPAVLKRRKMGFTAPLALWLRRDLNRYVGATLASPGNPLYAFLRRARVAELSSAVLDGRSDAAHQLWQILALAAWLNR